jgi:hypothetical protein
MTQMLTEPADTSDNTPGFIYLVAAYDAGQTISIMAEDASDDDVQHQSYTDQQVTRNISPQHAGLHGQYHATLSDLTSELVLFPNRCASTHGITQPQPAMMSSSTSSSTSSASETVIMSAAAYSVLHPPNAGGDAVVPVSFPRFLQHPAGHYEHADDATPVSHAALGNQQQQELLVINSLSSSNSNLVRKLRAAVVKSSKLHANAQRHVELVGNTLGLQPHPNNPLHRGGGAEGCYLSSTTLAARRRSQPLPLPSTVEHSVIGNNDCCRLLGSGTGNNDCSRLLGRVPDDGVAVFQQQQQQVIMMYYMHIMRTHGYSDQSSVKSQQCT